MTQTKLPAYGSVTGNARFSQSQQNRYMQLLLRLLPGATLFFMACAMLLLNAVLPLRGLWFYDSLVPRLGSWTLLPTHILFPHLRLIYDQSRWRISIPLGTTWKEAGVLFAVFTLVFLLYLLAVYLLSSRISQRFILLSTALLGIILVFCPVVVSQDVFSYIAYARMAVLYHLDPLTTVPAHIRHDPIYPYIFWVNQPSLYGPVWTLVTCILQEISLLVFGAKQLLPMVLMLRILDLALHLGSVQLVWLILGRLQGINGLSSPLGHTRRVQATLAFAWNPLLLLEACINAHSDTAVFFLLLVALWFLFSNPQLTYKAIVGAAVFFGLAICLKINYVLLLPGLLLFLWTRQAQRSWLKRLREGAVVVGICAIVCMILYIPFWGHGEIIHAVSVNPNTAHVANSLYEVAMRFYAARTGAAIASAAGLASSPLERFTHTTSSILFLIAYMALCLRALFVPKTISTPSGLLRWLALVWLLYCLLGAPWFWSWYGITFFGLFALIEADGATKETWLRISLIPLTVRVLAYTMLSVYCFYTWAPHVSIVHHLFHSQVLYLRGLWIWLLPGIVLCVGLLLQSLRKRSFVTHRISIPPGFKHMPGFLK